MKQVISKWFDNLKSSGLSDDQKKDIYENILIKKRFSSSFSKIVLRSGVAFFSVILMLIMSFAIVGNNSDKIPRQIDSVGDGFVSMIRSGGNSLVYADSIGSIVQTIGEVELYHDGNLILVDQLRHSDRILLHAGAEIVFLVRGDVQAKISGPAEFELLQSKSRDIYTINMIRGDYVELTSMDQGQIMKKNYNAEKNIFPTEEKNDIEYSEVFHVQVITNQVEVTTSSSEDHIQLAVHNKDGHQVIHNNGDKITVRKSIDNTGEITDIQTSQVASIQENIEVYLVDDDVQNINIYEQISLGSLKIVYDSGVFFEDLIPTDVVQEDSTNDLVVDTLAIQTNKGVENIVAGFSGSEEPSFNSPKGGAELSGLKSVDDVFEADFQLDKIAKRVMNVDQLGVIDGTIGSQESLIQARQILVSSYDGNSGILLSSLKKIQKSLAAISHSLHLDYIPSASSGSDLANSIYVIQSLIKEKYYVSPGIDRSFQDVLTWLSLASKLGSTTSDNCDITCLVDILDLTNGQKNFLQGY